MHLTQQTNRKLVMQQTIKADSELLEKDWQHIQSIKAIMDEEIDEKQKEILKNLYSALKNNYIVATAANSDRVSANLSFQPALEDAEEKIQQFFAKLDDEPTQETKTATPA
jgi:translation initiation factor 2B subunit (eIF-2B alpha/beta/delta family)